jgi:hypothetical protein
MVEGLKRLFHDPPMELIRQVHPSQQILEARIRPQSIKTPVAFDVNQKA